MNTLQELLTMIKFLGVIVLIGWATIEVMSADENFDKIVNVLIGIISSLVWLLGMSLVEWIVSK